MDAIVYVYEEDGVLLGCIKSEFSGERENRVVDLGMYGVDPDHQGRGIGRFLLKHALLEAAKKGIDIGKMIVISARRDLLEMYARLGFNETGEKIPFPPEDAELGFVSEGVHVDFTVLERRGLLSLLQ